MTKQKDEQNPLARSYSDPKDFLMAVMNDQSAPADIRIEAAGALMPYFHVELSQEQNE